MIAMVLIFLAAVMIVPFVIFQFMPGRKSVFVTACIMVIFLLDQAQSSIDYWNNFGFGGAIVQYMAVSTGLGFIVRVSVLFYRRIHEINLEPLWTRKDGITLAVVFLFVFAWLLMNSASVCIRELRILNANDIIERHLVGSEWYRMTREERATTLVENSDKFPGLYRVRKNKRTLLGQFRWSMSKIVVTGDDGSGGYGRDSYFQLNACGQTVSDPYRMSISRKNILKSREYSGYVEIGDLDEILAADQ